METTQKRPYSYRLVCAIVLTPLFVVGLIFFILWLSLRPHHPVFHVQDFVLQGLGETHGYIQVNVTVRNPNHRIRIYYDYMRGSVYYRDQRIGVVPVFESQYQKPKNTTVWQSAWSGPLAMATANNQRWTEFMNDRMHGLVVYSLEFKSVIKYRRSMWDSRSHRIRASCAVGVGPDGVILATYRGKRCGFHSRLT